MPDFLLYNATGSEADINGCRYALLKYLELHNLKPPADITIVVYTDQLSRFEAYLPFLPLLLQIPGKEHGNLQSKASIIDHFLQRRDGNLILCDAEVYPIKPLKPLFAQISKGIPLLYSDKVASDEQKRWLEKKSANTTTQLPTLPQTTALYQTTVVGIASSLRPQMEEANSLYHQAQQHLPKPIAENLVFSHLLQQHAPINTANEYFAAYIGLPEFRPLLHAFFSRNEEESIPNLVKAVHHLNAAALLQQKRQFDRLPLYRKWWQRFQGKGWSLRPHYNKF